MELVLRFVIDRVRRHLDPEDGVFVHGKTYDHAAIVARLEELLACYQRPRVAALVAQLRAELAAIFGPRSPILRDLGL